MESLKKQNIGAAVKTIEKYNGSTPFMVAYVTQQALAGHSIPVNQGLLESMRIVGVVSDGEAAKGAVPGLERTVPKSKGAEVGSQLHQLGVEMFRSPYGPTIRKLLLEIEPGAKDQLPKRPPKGAEEPTGVEAKAAASLPPAAPSPAPKPGDASAKKTAAKKGAPEAPAKAQPSKKPVKKVLKKKVHSSGGKKKTTATKRLTKRKPR